MTALAALTGAEIPDATDEESMFLEVVSELSNAEVESQAQEIESSGEVPAALITLLIEQELAAISAPPEVGGSGGRPLLATLAVERIAEASAAVGMELGLRQAGVMAIASREDVDPRIDGMTPPVLVDSAGSALLIDGRLIGSAAAGLGIDADTDVVVVAADGTGGERAVLLPAGGAAIEPYVRTGLRGLSCGHLEFDRSEGAVDLGARSVEAGRRAHDLAIAACAVGVGRRAVRAASEYLQERHQFGRPLSHFGALRLMLSEAAARVAAAAALLHLAASGASTASQAATVAAETALAVSDDSLQVHGGYGYISEYLPERLLRDAVTLRAIVGAEAVTRSAGALLAESP
jgi:alkylation response protein AidB-like acyl-CoA dehydrogenase